MARNKPSDTQYDPDPRPNRVRHPVHSCHELHTAHTLFHNRTVKGDGGMQMLRCRREGHQEDTRCRSRAAYFPGSGHCSTYPADIQRNSRETHRHFTDGAAVRWQGVHTFGGVRGHSIRLRGRAREYLREDTGGFRAPQLPRIKKALETGPAVGTVRGGGLHSHPAHDHLRTIQADHQCRHRIRIRQSGIHEPRSDKRPGSA